MPFSVSENGCICFHLNLALTTFTNFHGKESSTLIPFLFFCSMESFSLFNGCSLLVSFLHHPFQRKNVIHHFSPQMRLPPSMHIVPVTLSPGNLWAINGLNIQGISIEVILPQYIFIYTYLKVEKKTVRMP